MKSSAVAFFSLILFAVTTSAAMAASDNGRLPRASLPQFIQVQPMPPGQAKSPALQRGKKIYFYSFDGTYLRSSAGTFYMPPVKLVNHGTEDLRTTDGTEKKMEVKLTVLDRKVTQVDVYPDHEQ